MPTIAGLVLLVLRARICGHRVATTSSIVDRFVDDMSYHRYYSGYALVCILNKTAHMLQTAAAWLFVIIWSSGFVVARGISDLIDPYYFLLVRFSIVTALFALAMAVFRVALPRRSQLWKLMLTGAFMQALYLGPGFWAVSQGMEAGVMALMGALQPPMTAIAARHLFDERITKLTVVGLVIGLAGVAVAVAPNLSLTVVSSVSDQAGSAKPFYWVLLAAIVSICSVTVGTLLQKTSISSVPLLCSVTFQTLGASLVMMVMAAIFAQPIFPVTLLSMTYLAWAVGVLSIGGFTLLTWMVRTGSATRASSLLFIVPPLAAMLSWLLYDESLTHWQIAGFVMALTGVTLARYQPS